jgi:NitT/TauT family transport system substrate-binding protein
MNVTTTARLGMIGALVLPVAAACGGGSDESAPGGSGDPATISVALAQVSASVCMKVSDDRGLFKDAGLTLKFVPPAASGSAQIAQVVNGQLTAGFGGYTSVISAVASGVGVVLTNSMERDTETAIAVIVGKKSGVTRFRDLEGKTVGINALGGSWEINTREAIALDGGDPSKVKLVPVGFGDQSAALASNRVDAITTAQPVVVGLTSAGYKNIGNPQAALMGAQGTSGGGIFMSKKYVEANPDIVKRFVETAQKGNEYCNDPANADLMVKEISAFTDLPADLVKKAPLPDFDATLDTAETKKWVDAMAKYDIVKKAPAADQVQWSGALAHK